MPRQKLRITGDHTPGFLQVVRGRERKLLEVRSQREAPDSTSAKPLSALRVREKLRVIERDRGLRCNSSDQFCIVLGEGAVLRARSVPAR
jgi:hypothetical protein